ncbi:hypothetical protein CDAR_310561 [Caerostris darwini]|uniref:Uncharacterized protein n=1 Tax=Caerostris darwini TaxID=1538125 RepID=A0AAV4WPU3_9ARAC|nr:hypothetical protein CDAR_310561 [Caerostris darwini]
MQSIFCIRHDPHTRTARSHKMQTPLQPEIHSSIASRTGSHGRLYGRSARQPQRDPGGIRPPVARHFHLLLPLKSLRVSLVKLSDVCNDMVASGPECRWKLQLVGFGPALRHDISPLMTSHMTSNPLQM